MQYLDDLERYSIYLFDAFVKTGETLSWIRQSPEVRVPFERSPELQTSSTEGRRFSESHLCPRRCDPLRMFTPPQRGPTSVSIVHHHATGR
jgi:hypothetical protein